MAVIVPPGGVENPRKPTVKGSPIRPAKAVETEYRRTFFRNVRAMRIASLAIGRDIIAGIPLEETLARLAEMERITLTPERAAMLAERIVRKADDSQKERFTRVISRAFGVDRVGIIDDRKLREAFNIETQRNIDLITSVRQEFITDVRTAVLNNFQGIEQPEGRTLLQQIQHVSNVTKSRSELIARDQAQKLNSSFNQLRQENAGIEEYIWRTAEDSRVVGTPGGLYEDPTSAHGNHYNRNGKTFRWDNPPADGHPGQAINCRCIAEPIINREKVVENTLSRII